MMEVVSLFINPDLFVCRQYPSLGRPTGTSSRFVELSEALTAYTGSVNSGKWVYCRRYRYAPRDLERITPTYLFVPNFYHLPCLARR